MKKYVYEWVIEHVSNDQYQDILDLDHADNLMEFSSEEVTKACKNHQYLHEQLGPMFMRLALRRDTVREFDGIVDSRWAYVENNNLSSTYEEGGKVLNKFNAELQKFFLN